MPKEFSECLHNCSVMTFWQHANSTAVAACKVVLRVRGSCAQSQGMHDQTAALLLCFCRECRCTCSWQTAVAICSCKGPDVIDSSSFQYGRIARHGSPEGSRVSSVSAVRWLSAVRGCSRLPGAGTMAAAAQLCILLV